MIRYYPPELPAFDREPTRDRFDIRQFSDRVGEGAVSLVAFAAGDVVFAFTGFMVRSPTKFTLQVRTGEHLHDPYFMGKVLHHCDPNCVVDMDRRVFIAVRPIAAGEAITMDYDQTEDTLHQGFDCDCGSPQCRRRISGRLQPS